MSYRPDPLLTSDPLYPLLSTLIRGGLPKDKKLKIILSELSDFRREVRGHFHVSSLMSGFPGSSFGPPWNTSELVVPYWAVSWRFIPIPRLRLGYIALSIIALDRGAPPLSVGLLRSNGKHTVSNTCRPNYFHRIAAPSLVINRRFFQMGCLHFHKNGLSSLVDGSSSW